MLTQLLSAALMLIRSGLNRHIGKSGSVLQDAFVSDPSDIVKNGQLVNVRVSSWDPAVNRLSLTMKSPTESGTYGVADGGRPSEGGQVRRNPRQGKVATAGRLICNTPTMSTDTSSGMHALSRHNML